MEPLPTTLRKEHFFVRHRVFFFGLIISLLFFFFLEYQYPYTFLKDDNLNQFLPVILEGMQQLFNGHLPVWNPYQYTGSPLLEYGIYAVLYPLMILSYVISHYVTHNDFLLFEFFVLFHLIAGYCATFFLLRSRRIQPLLSLIGAIAFVFSGYALIASGSWYYVAPVLLFLPLIFLFHDRLHGSRDLRTPLFLGAIRGLFFYAGNAQFFVYALLFEFLYFLFLYFRDRPAFLPLFERYALSFLVTFIIALPLALAQAHAISDSTRQDLPLSSSFLSYSSHPLDVLAGQFLPYPLYHSRSPFARSPSSFSEIYYAGTFFFLAALVGAGLLVRRHRSHFFLRMPPFFWLGCLSLLLSLGWKGIVYLLGFVLPFWSSFIAPFRFTIFTLFFFTLSGAFSLSEFLRWKHVLRYSRYLLVTIFILFMILMIHHLRVSAPVGWSSRVDPVPLVFPASFDFGDERVLSLFPATHPDFTPLSKVAALTHNYPTYFKIFHIAGYESFPSRLIDKNIGIRAEALRGARLNLDTLAEYGVQWIVMPSNSTLDSALQKLPVAYHDKQLLILQIIDAKSLVFADSVSVPNTLMSNGFIFDTDFSDSQRVTVNTLYREDYTARIDGKRVDTFVDPLDRVTFDVPAGEHRVSLLYSPRFFCYGLLLSVSILVLLFVYLRFFRTQLLLRLRLFSSHKFHEGHRRIIFFVFGLVFFLLFVSSFLRVTSPSSFAREVKEITGLEFDITDVVLFTFPTLTFSDISLSEPFTNTRVFSADRLVVHLDLLETFQSIVGTSRTALYFDRLDVYNVSLSLGPGFWSLFSSGTPDLCALDKELAQQIPSDSFSFGDQTITSPHLVAQSLILPLQEFSLRSLEGPLTNSSDSESSVYLSLDKHRKRYYVYGSFTAQGSSYPLGTCLILNDRSRLYTNDLFKL